MSSEYAGMSEAEAMAELARLLWERYMKPRASEELLNHSLDGYKAQVYSNNGDGTLTVIRPFDNTSMTLRCPPALAENAQAGDQVLVIQLGDASNSFILCGTDLSGFASGVSPTEVGSITLSATWSGTGPYYQTVTVTGATVTANSKVDLQPTAAQIETMISEGVAALTVENNSGTLTAYANGAPLMSAMTVQCTVMEVLP